MHAECQRWMQGTYIVNTSVLRFSSSTVEDNIFIKTSNPMYTPAICKQNDGRMCGKRSVVVSSSLIDLRETERYQLPPDPPGEITANIYTVNNVNNNM